mmetsp:Transcript_19773/g.57361  ORF Transcript_19773/g.57361 Transcript_19773/m.57361 type:complete len:356 (+) Transcript_19773:187-1254(+)
MLATRALMSSVSASTVPLASSMALERSATSAPRAFFSSSALSSSAAQNAFLSSSAACSLPSRATISSIMWETLSKDPLRPLSAMATRASLGSTWLALAGCSAARARPLSSPEETSICSRLELGRAFLKRSRASSSLSMRMAAATAASSWDLIWDRFSHSDFRFKHDDVTSAKNFLSCASDSLVSSRSALVDAISTPTSPSRRSFASMATVLAAICFCLAAPSASKSLMLCCSSAVISTRDFCMSSLSCLRIPMIWLVSTEPCDRNDASASRSSEPMSESTARRRSAAAPEVCRKLPAVPSSSAAMAFDSAAMLALYSADSVAKAAADFSRSALASAALLLASARSALSSASDSEI